MNIPKAIEILEETPINILSGSNLGYNEARKLGIEALKVYQELRNQGNFQAGYLLPSETRE